MSIDLRDKIKKDRKMKELPTNHRKLFEERLQKELHSKVKNKYAFLKIAASILILVSLGFASYQLLESNKTVQEVVQSEELLNDTINSMADISPDLKKVENFYLTQINQQISTLKMTEENRDLLEVYLSELSVLQQEYEDLNTRLNRAEVNEETINALIENLQLRLELLRQLKRKLEIIENLKSKENENKQA